MELLKTLLGGTSKIWAALSNGSAVELAQQNKLDELNDKIGDGQLKLKIGQYDNPSLSNTFSFDVGVNIEAIFYNVFVHVLNVSGFSYYEDTMWNLAVKESGIIIPNSWQVNGGYWQIMSDISGSTCEVTIGKYTSNDVELKLPFVTYIVFYYS